MCFLLAHRLVSLRRTDCRPSEAERTYVSKLEKCATYVGLEIIGKLAKVLDVQPAEFLIPPPRKKRGT